MPPRTVFVGVDDEAIVEDAFNLMKKRGLENFAFVHTVEASEILRGASHTPRPLRGSVFGLGGNSYAIPRS